MKDQALNDALVVLTKLGATIVDNVQFSEFRKGYYERNKDEWELSFLIELRDSQ